MFGIRKCSINASSSMTIISLFVLFLVANQFLLAHSFRLMHDDLDQDEPGEVRRALIRHMAFDNFADPLPDGSFRSEAVLFAPQPTVQRRFCCMHPLSGRKRSVRDLARQQLANQQA